MPIGFYHPAAVIFWLLDVYKRQKHLYEKGYIQREPHPQDDRSYLLSLTEAGRIELKKDCETILNPLYHLRRNMGEHFDTLFELISEANLQIDSRRNNGF